MQKNKIIFCITTVFILSTSACSLDGIKNSALEAKNSTEEKINNVKTEIDRVTNTVIETKEKFENKVDKGKKVIEAINEFNEA